MPGPVSQLGSRFIRFVGGLGGMARFTVSVARASVTPPLRLSEYLRELYKLGVLSLVIVCVSGIAVGMVLGLQGFHTLSRFGAEHSVGELVGLSLIRELGPVLTALLLAGSAGSATAAEIASMVVTQQLDGLRMLSIDPVSFAIKPKAAAMLTVTPMLTAMFIICGIYGGYLVDVGILKGDPGSYMAGLHSAISFQVDIACCLLKSMIFGAMLGLVATYRGYTSEPTAEGVSAATTSAVVIASVGVLLCDYIITALWGI